LSVKWIQYSMSPLAALEEEQLVLGLTQPPIEIPVAKPQMMTQEGLLTTEGAQQVLELWLTSKSEAFGSKHQVESLNKILADSLLSLWGDRAQKLKKNQNHWQYKHTFTIKDLKTTNNNPRQAIVDANVREIAKFYEQGKLNQSRSYDDQLQVRYELSRQGDDWRIKSIKVINY
ncbi:MAG TPA: molecular chaperone DnaJ, partial [Cyanothece sp. UBA12306]|nr:molecular chaperone DnaJ [Cyanothece sp. UBA12306]